MAETILMPRQGNSVESCVLIKWRVQAGDPVQAKTIVADVETDKATFEIEAGCTGTVLKLLAAEGDDVPVMQAIAYVGQAGEDLSSLISSSTSQAAPAADQAEFSAGSPADTAAVAAAVEPAVKSTTSRFASPRARHLAHSRGLDAANLKGSGPDGRVIERDVLSSLGQSAPATAAAIAQALSLGVQLPAQGSGLGGRVALSDLSSVAGIANPGSSATSAAVQSSSHSDDSGDYPGPSTTVKIKSIRKLIGQRMAESLATTAQFTMSASALAVRLQELRARFKTSDPALGLQGITIGDIIVCATVRTLSRFPFMNAHKIGDSIIEFQHVHVGIACDTARGLMVPVLHNADSLSLKKISDETKRLAEACRNGSIKPDELTGSTFSISNLGASGVESFTPVLNVPEVAILGVCGISPKPVQNGDETVFLPSVGLSLTIDHMVVDGAPASRFLKELCNAIADCDLLLAK